MSSQDDRKGRGRFIVVEGLDRAGKSTQVERLAARLGEAKVCKFPGERESESMPLQRPMECRPWSSMPGSLSSSLLLGSQRTIK